MHGKVYYIGSAKQADNYNTTTEDIMEYFLRKYTHGLDLVQTLKALKMKDFGSEMPVLSVPSGVSDEQKAVLTDVYKEETKYFVKRKKMLNTNIVMACGVIWGQCTKSLRTKLEARKEWNVGDAKYQIKYNAINLLKAIKQITHNYQDNKYAMESIYYSLRTIFTMKQNENENLTEFTKRFNNTFDIIETQHGELSLSAYLANRSDYKAATTKAAKTAIHKDHYNKIQSICLSEGSGSEKVWKTCGRLGKSVCSRNGSVSKDSRQGS